MFIQCAGNQAQWTAQPSSLGSFIGNEKVAVLGDNILAGSFGRQLRANTDPDGAIVYAYYVNDPERYGVVTFDENDQAVSIVEASGLHPTIGSGLYFYDNDVLEIAANLGQVCNGEYKSPTLTGLPRSRQAVCFENGPWWHGWIPVPTMPSCRPLNTFRSSRNGKG